MVVGRGCTGIQVGPWDGEEDEEEEDEEDGRRRVVEYEVEFATKRVGIRFNNVKVGR